MSGDEDEFFPVEKKSKRSVGNESVKSNKKRGMVIDKNEDIDVSNNSNKKQRKTEYKYEDTIDNDGYRLKAVIDTPILFKNIIDAIKELRNDVKMQWKTDGLYIETMDNAKVSVVYLDRKST